MPRRAALKTIGALCGAAASLPLLTACQELPARATPTPAPSEDSRRRGSAGQPPAPAIATTPGSSASNRKIVTWLVDEPIAAAGSTGMSRWADLVFQSLVTFDEDLKIVPCLADAWTHPDPTTWTFRIRRGVRFHDGSELAPDDVIASLERLTIAPSGQASAGLLGALDRVDAVGRFEIRLRLRHPYMPLLNELAGRPDTAIVPRRLADHAAPLTEAIGTGPFTLAPSGPDGLHRLSRHDGYWERGLPRVDEVVVSSVPSDASRIAAMRDGRASLAELTPEAADALREDRGLRILSSPGPVQCVSYLNTTRKPFDDPRVRRAVGLAVDRLSAITRVLGGYGSLTGPVPTGQGQWSLPPERLPGRRDPARARQLLEEAGYRDGFDTTILAPADQSVAARMAAVVAGQLGEVGVRARVESLELGELWRSARRREFAILTVTTGFEPDPDSYLYPRFHSLGPENLTGWSSDRLDILLESGHEQAEPDHRKAVYDEAQAILLEAAPAHWWFSVHRLEAVRTALRGYRSSFSGRPVSLKAVRLED